MSDGRTVSLPMQHVLSDVPAVSRDLLIEVESRLRGNDCPDGYLAIERAEETDVLLLFSHTIHSAIRFTGTECATLPVTSLFAEALSKPARRVRFCRADAGLVLLAAVVFQNKPAFKAKADVADLARELDEIRAAGKCAAILLTRGIERNLVYCRDGVPIAAYFARPATMATESSVHDRILAYAYVAPAETTVEVFYALDSRRDEHADRRFADLIDGRLGPPPFMLAVVQGKERLQRRLLQSGSAKVGRDPANDIVIDHLSISRNQCTVSWEGTSFVVRDAGSANGTRVNGVRVEQSTLNPGDRIAIGDFELVFGTGDEVHDEEVLQTVFMEPTAPQQSPHLLIDGAPVVIDTPVFTIGKGASANLRLSGLFMKPIQATLVREGSGRHRLLRVEGGRAVRVRGKEVSAGGAILESGSEITIGKHTLVFVLPQDR
jgi:pSer/pThr/pTyr-binding forkhead associated (FHA) protein